MGIAMGFRTTFVAFFLLTCLAPTVFADIYKCVSADGQVTYSNIQDKNCKRLSLDPMPPTAPSSAAARPAAKTPTPATFPKVEENAQKARDNDRRRILESELEAEQKNLEQAKKDLAEQEAQRSGNERNYQKVLDRLQPFKDKVAMHERNIEAVQKELSRLR